MQNEVSNITDGALKLWGKFMAERGMSEKDAEQATYALLYALKEPTTRAASVGEGFQREK